jgi:hypothetical protein
VRGATGFGWPSRVTLLKTDRALKCDVLWPSYEARGACEHLAAATS